VDIVPENAEGSVFLARMVLKCRQVVPLFDHLPVNELVNCGLQISVTMNDQWRVKGTCWNFIPVDPLLALMSMKDLMDLSSDISQTSRRRRQRRAQAFIPLSQHRQSQVKARLRLSK